MKQMKRILSMLLMLVMLLSLVTSFASALVSEQGKFKARVTVKDEDGNFIPGVTVSVTKGGAVMASGVTNGSGEYWYTTDFINVGINGDNIQTTRFAGSFSSDRYTFVSRTIGGEYTIGPGHDGETQAGIDANGIRLAGGVLTPSYAGYHTCFIDVAYTLHDTQVQYTVTYWVGEDQYTSQQVTNGQTTSAPAAPGAPAGQGFSHWSESEGGSAFDFSTPITGDLALHAVFKDLHTVTFMANGAQYETADVLDGGCASAPAADPTWAGSGDKEFSHWSESEGGSAFDFSAGITADKTLYAVWTEYFNVSFDVSELTNGSDPAFDDQRVASGATAAEPAETPVRDPSFAPETIFLFWSDNQQDTEFDFSAGIAADTLLHPVWTSPTYYEVVFMSAEGGTVLATLQVEENTAIAAADIPAAPAAPEGKTFAGWYKLVEGQPVPVDLAAAVTGAMTLYPNYEDIVLHTVKFFDVDGTELTALEQSVQDGQSATSPSYVPEYSDAEMFRHWALRGTSEAYDFATPVTEDIELVAVTEGCVAITFETYLWDHEGYRRDAPEDYPNGTSFGGGPHHDVTGLHAQTNTVINGLAFDLKIYDYPGGVARAWNDRIIIGSYATPGTVKIPIRTIMAAITASGHPLSNNWVIDIDPVVTSLGTYNNGDFEETTTFDWDWEVQTATGGSGLTGVRVIPNSSILNIHGNGRPGWQGINDNDVIWLDPSAQSDWQRGFSFTFKAWVVPALNVFFDTDGGTMPAGTDPKLFDVQKFKPVNSLPGGGSYGRAQDPGSPTRGQNEVFLGWYEVLHDGSLAPSSFDFSTPIMHSKTLKARYGQAPVQVDWVVRAEDTDDNTQVLVWSKYPVAVGDRPVYANYDLTTGLPIVPTGKSPDAEYSYEFVGWTDEADGQTAKWDITGTPIDPVGGPTTYYAVFVQTQRTVFYVYHSGVVGGNVETIYIDSLTNGKYDITQNVSAGTLYGGYYRDYAGKGNYAGDGVAPTEGSTIYSGGPGVWAWSSAFLAAPNAETGEGGPGTAMKPLAGQTYFVKEIPANYLRPYLHIVYEKNGGRIVNGYLMTGVDDLNFRSLDLQYYTGGGWKGLATAFKVYEEANISNATTLTCQSVFKAPGFLGIWEKLPSGTITYRATFKTPDGVDVYGFAQRVVTAGDGHYYPSYHFEENVSNTGIYRVDTTYDTWRAVS